MKRNSILFYAVLVCCVQTVFSEELEPEAQTPTDTPFPVSIPTPVPTLTTKSNIGFTPVDAQGQNFGVDTISPKSSEIQPAQVQTSAQTPAQSSARSARSEYGEESSDSSFLGELLILGLPVLFIPALSLALLYLLWGGMYSSYNYHNGLPSHGQGVAFQQKYPGHGGGGGWRSLQKGPQLPDHVTARILDSI